MKKETKQKLELLFIPCQENDFRPKLLTSRFLVNYVIFLVLLKFISVGFLLLLPKTSFFADISSQEIISIVNNGRLQLGLAPLNQSKKLTEAAYSKAEDMFNLDYFGHYSPEGKSPWYWFKKVKYDYQYAGENLAIGFVESSETYSAWKQSPLHYANIANSRYQETGVAVLKGIFQGNEVYLIVQLFGAPAEEKSPITAKAQTEPIGPIQPEKKKQEVAANDSTIVKGEETEEIIVPDSETVVNPAIGQIVSESEQRQKTFAFAAANFLATKYNRILEGVLFASILILTIILLINIFIRIDVQRWDLTAKTSSLILILIILFLFGCSQASGRPFQAGLLRLIF